MTEKNEDVVSKSTFRMSIIASIVASIIFIALIQPIMTYVWEVISSTSNDYLNAHVDRIYKNAALGDRNWVIATFFTIGVYVPFVATSSKIFVYWLAQKVSKTDEENEEEKQEKATLFKLAWIRWVSLVLGIASATMIASYVYTDMQLNASFNQRLTVLAPHITEREYMQYKADWASMSSKKDYQLLNNKLQTQADGLSVELPLPLLSD